MTYFKVPKNRRREWNDKINEYMKGCKFRECVYPDCNNKPIKAHSVQKNRILRRIAYNGEVMAYYPKETLISGTFETIGVKKASTFNGFCNPHDTSLFSEIENRDYIATLEQNFLFAYRSCAWRFAGQKETLCIYQKLLNEFSNIPKYVQLLNKEITWIKKMLRMLKLNLERFHIELSKETDRVFNNLYTYMRELPYSSLLAICSLIGINTTKDNFENNLGKTSFFFFNVFPQNDSTFILLSCFKQDWNNNKSLFAYFESLNDNDLEIFLSGVILMDCRNIFTSPIKMTHTLSINILSNFFKIWKRTVFYDQDTKLEELPKINLFQSLKQ